MLSTINMIASIALRHTRVLAHAPHGMPRRRRDTGIVRTVQCVTVSSKHVFMLVYTYSKRSQKHEAVQRSKHAPRGPLRTDARTALTRLRHAPINSAELVRRLVRICSVCPEKTRRQTVSVEVLRPPPCKPLRTFVSRFPFSSNAAERQRDLSAVPITGTGIVPFSSKGVSQGGSAARASASKNGSLAERRVHARRWMRVSL